MKYIDLDDLEALSAFGADPVPPIPEECASNPWRSQPEHVTFPSDGSSLIASGAMKYIPPYTKAAFENNVRCAIVEGRAPVRGYIDWMKNEAKNIMAASGVSLHEALKQVPFPWKPRPPSRTYGDMITGAVNAVVGEEIGSVITDTINQATGGLSAALIPTTGQQAAAGADQAIAQANQAAAAEEAVSPVVYVAGALPLLLLL